MAIMTWERRKADGTIEKGEGTGPSFSMAPDAMWAATKAQEALSAGKPIEEALKAVMSARHEQTRSPVAEAGSLDDEAMEMIRYIHAICRLNNNQLEDLTPKGLLEVAMLCPYPVVSLEEWREKMRTATNG